MASTSASARPAGSRTALGPGSVVGGRFEIERAASEHAIGTLLAARDRKTGRPIALWVLAPGLIATPAALETLRTEIKAAASISQKNLTATYGMGTDPSGARFVATEWVEGRTLAEHRADWKATGEPISLRGAYNIIAHVCRALEAAHAKGKVHGALRPSVVWVTKAGRVKVAGLGLDRAIVQAAGPAALGASEQAYLAPEVKAGGAPDARSDVFGIGGLLYGMLTGRSAADDFIAPSDAHPEATAELDAVLLKCLAADPDERFSTPEEVRAALVRLAVGTEPPTDAQDFGVDIEVDLDIDASASAAPEPAEPPEPAALPAPPAAPTPMPPPGPPAPEPAPAAAATEVDLGALLSKITENDAARWMVVKDRLDHGPFSGRELVQLILKGEVLGEHGLLNMDTGERGTVGESPDFAEFVEQYEIKKAEAEHAMALERSAKREKLSVLAKGAILAGVLAVVGIGVGIFLLTRPDAEEQQLADADLADLYERGEIEITGAADILDDPPPARRGRGARGGGRRGAMSYEDAMNQLVDLGSATQTGSMARLSPQQVAGVMNRNINRLLPCVAREPNVGTVRIDMAIAGSGEVLGASVRNGSPSFQSCVASRVRRIRFPSFAAPRMGASFTFSTD